MKALLKFTALVVLATSFTGCSRFREKMTRRDYALLRDPFTGRADEATASVAPTEPSIQASPLSQAGIARVTPAGKAKLSDSATANYSNVASVAPAEPKTAANTTGVSSTKFPGAQASSMNESVATAKVDADPSAAANPFAAAIEAASQQTAAGAQNSDVNATDQAPDMAGLAKFMEDQAKASGMTDTAKNLSEDLSEFAAQRKKAWDSEVAAVEEKAAPLIQSVRQVSQTVEQVAGQSNNAGTAVTNSGFSSAVNATTQPAEKAQPFITNQLPSPQAQRPAVRKSTQPPIGNANPFAAIEAAMTPATASSKQTTPPTPVFSAAVAADSDANNPFSAFDTQDAGTRNGASVVAKPSEFDSSNGETSGKVSGDTLDAGFSFDSGWRPSTATRP